MEKENIIKKYLGASAQIEKQILEIFVNSSISIHSEPAYCSKSCQELHI